MEQEIVRHLLVLMSQTEYVHNKLLVKHDKKEKKETKESCQFPC